MNSTENHGGMTFLVTDDEDDTSEDEVITSKSKFKARVMQQKQRNTHDAEPSIIEIDSFSQAFDTMTLNGKTTDSSTMFASVVYANKNETLKDYSVISYSPKVKNNENKFNSVNHEALRGKLHLLIF